MFYICKRKNIVLDKIEVFDTDDGIVETLTESEVLDYVKRGIKIDGVTGNCIIHNSDKSKEFMKRYESKILKEVLAGTWDKCNSSKITNYILSISVNNYEGDIFCRDTEIDNLTFSIRVSFDKFNVLRRDFSLITGSDDSDSPGSPFPVINTPIYSSYEFLFSLEDLATLDKDNASKRARKILNCFFHTLGGMLDTLKFNRVSLVCDCYSLSDRLYNLDFNSEEINISIQNKVY